MADRHRVLFRLTMPGVGSWNGRWSGEGRNYTLVRTLTDRQMQGAGMEKGRGSWGHAWSDGWRANVSAQVMQRGEREPRSDGFCGYEWMVKNIIHHGTTYCEHDWRPDQNPPGEGEWERCSRCGTSQRLRKMLEG